MRRPKAAPTPKGRSLLQVSECAQRFAHACSNPWSQRALGACLPIDPVRPSQKICQRMRVSTTIGTNGCTFILISPSIANDRAFAWYGGGSYTPSDVAAFVATATNTTTTVGVTAVSMTGLPLNATQVVSDDFRAAFRIVSVGVSGQYIGTPLNMAGQWIGYINPDGSTLNSGAGTSFNVPSLSNLPGFKTAAVTKSKFSLVTPPLDLEGQQWFRPAESFINNNTGGYAYPWARETINGGTINGASVSNGEAPILLLLTGGVAGQGVVYDVIVHLEMVTKTAYLTPSHIDEVAAKAIVDLANKSNASPTWHPTAKQLMDGLVSVISHGTRMVTAVAPVARQMGRLAITAAPLAIGM